MSQDGVVDDVLLHGVDVRGSLLVLDCLVETDDVLGGDDARVVGAFGHSALSFANGRRRKGVFGARAGRVQNLSFQDGLQQLYIVIDVVDVAVSNYY